MIEISHAHCENKNPPSSVAIQTHGQRNHRRSFINTEKIKTRKATGSQIIELGINQLSSEAAPVIETRSYCRAVEDADHTLSLMDVCRDHSPDEEWTMSHEQYRPFVLFHRTQAAALAALDESDAENAIAQINAGLEQMKEVFIEHEAEEEFDEDEMVQQLSKLRDSLREEYALGPTLQERLAEAVKTEQYELAARLRDELARQQDH